MNQLGNEHSLPFQVYCEGRLNSCIYFSNASDPRSVTFTFALYGGTLASKGTYLVQKSAIVAQIKVRGFVAAKVA